MSPGPPSPNAIPGTLTISSRLAYANPSSMEAEMKAPRRECAYAFDARKWVGTQLRMPREIRRSASPSSQGRTIAMYAVWNDVTISSAQLSQTI